MSYFSKELFVETKTNLAILGLTLSFNAIAGGFFYYANRTQKSLEIPMYPPTEVCLTQDQAFDIVVKNIDRDPIDAVLNAGSKVTLVYRAGRYYKETLEQRDRYRNRGGNVTVSPPNGRLITGLVQGPYCRVVFPIPLNPEK